MAINISLILKEESEVNQIVDPFSGSHIIENYTETICNAAWSIFQEIEKLGGIETETSQSFLHKEVERIRQKRLSAVSSKKQVLVGINNYQNPDNSNLNWKEEVGNFLGLENLIIEKDLSKSDKF
jgi:methylmalonyl-CoA mutase